jgi:hypothetical protein
MSNRATIYTSWQGELNSLLSFLNTLPVGHLTDEQLQKLRIELSDLDFFTGKTSYATPLYFKPTDQTVYKVDSSEINPAEDIFIQSCKSKQRKVYGDKGWPEYLLGAFEDYHRALSSKYSSVWRFLTYVYLCSGHQSRCNNTLMLKIVKIVEVQVIGILLMAK